MKKFFMLFVFLSLFNQGFCETNDDYILFLNGKNAYLKKDFYNAKLNFETLLKSFSKSDIFTNNYPYFYVGMTYYNLKDYEKAIYFLEKSIYSPKIFENENFQAETSYFLAERDFALGKSFINIGDIETGSFYLQRLNYTTYYPLVSSYEKEALQILSEHSDKAYKKFRLKFEYDFSVIDSFSISEILDICSFYNSKKEYEHEEKLYESILRKENLTLEEKSEILERYFDFLLSANLEEKIIAFTENSSSELQNLYNFYRGLAFYKMRDFSRALYLFNNIEKSKYFSQGNYYIASIYFTLGEYSEALNALKNISNKNIVTDSMAAFSYYSLKDFKNLNRAIKAIEKKYPNTYVGLYFKNLKENSSDISLNSLENLLKFSNTVIDSFEPMPENFLQSGDIIEIDQISKVSKLKDKKLLRVAIEKSIFWKKNNPQSALAITTILENGSFYELAFRNSQNNLGNFSQYRGLFKYNFPTYYQNSVNKFAQKYDIPQELIYTVIHELTGFNAFHVSEDSRFGLMNIPYDENSNFSFFELFDINRNIEEGSKILHEYLIKYKGNQIKALIAYVYGENYLKGIYFDYNNDVNLATILDPKERFFLQNLFVTYIFYSKLYQFK